MNRNAATDTLSVTTYLLTDDDAPGSFTARHIVLMRDDLYVEAKPGVRISGRPAVAVTVDPPLEAHRPADGPLDKAILVPRHSGVPFDDLCRGCLAAPASVFVLRFSGSIASLAERISPDDVEVALWGLVSPAS